MTRRRTTTGRQSKSRCAECGASLVGARLIIDGHWMCPVCAYELEHGPVERVRQRRQRVAPPQEVTLFGSRHSPPEERSGECVTLHRSQ